MSFLRKGSDHKPLALLQAHWLASDDFGIRTVKCMVFYLVDRFWWAHIITLSIYCGQCKEWEYQTVGGNSQPWRWRPQKYPQSCTFNPDLAPTFFFKSTRRFSALFTYVSLCLLKNQSVRLATLMSGWDTFSHLELLLVRAFLFFHHDFSPFFFSWLSSAKQTYRSQCYILYCLSSFPCLFTNSVRDKRGFEGFRVQITCNPKSARNIFPVSLRGQINPLWHGCHWKECHSCVGITKETLVTVLCNLTCLWW